MHIQGKSKKCDSVCFMSAIFSFVVTRYICLSVYIIQFCVYILSNEHIKIYITCCISYSQCITHSGQTRFFIYLFLVSSLSREHSIFLVCTVFCITWQIHRFAMLYTYILLRAIYISLHFYA